MTRRRDRCWIYFTHTDISFFTRLYICLLYLLSHLATNQTLRHHCLTLFSSITITVLLVQSHRWLCGCSSCVLAFTAMWATLAGAQQTGCVGEILDAVFWVLPAEAFVSGGSASLVMIGQKAGAVKLWSI